MTSSRTSQTERARTLTERVRRAQLIEVTIELVADHGFAGVSLSGIASRAGITKAAVLYHFPSKAAVVDAAHQHALAALVTDVTAAIESAGPGEAVAAYIRSMIGHLRDHPRHTRMIIEAMTGGGATYASADRWRPLADVIGSTQRARGARVPGDARTLAIIISGAIDAIVAEQLTDPGYDTAAAAEELIAMLDAVLAAGGPAASRARASGS